MLARALTIEDHPLFADALRTAMSAAFPGATVTQAHSFAEARALLADDVNFDLVLLDLWLPDAAGLQALISLRDMHPKLPIVVVSAFEQAEVARRSILCGATGFVSKRTTRTDLIAAIRQVMRGDLALPPCLAEAPPSASRTENMALLRMRQLTAQQLRVLLMLCRGLLNKQIAFEMGVGETTVKAHVSEILRKLEVNSRTQAVVEVSETDFAAMLRRSVTRTLG